MTVTATSWWLTKQGLIESFQTMSCHYHYTARTKSRVTSCRKQLSEWPTERVHFNTDLRSKPDGLQQGSCSLAVLPGFPGFSGYLFWRSLLLSLPCSGKLLRSWLCGECHSSLRAELPGELQLPGHCDVSLQEGLLSAGFISPHLPVKRFLGPITS